MESVSEKQREWKEYFLPRAEGGYPDAQINVAAAFAIGKYLPKDLTQSEFWFRKASETIGERALFPWMKVLVRARDPRIHALFSEKDEWNLGAIYYLYGFHLASEARIAEARAAFKKGMDKGSLFSEGHFYKYKYSWPFGFLCIPHLFIVVAKIGLTAWKNKDDERVLR